MSWLFYVPYAPMLSNINLEISSAVYQRGCIALCAFEESIDILVIISAFRRPFSRLVTLNHDMPRTQTLDLDLRPSRCPRLSRSSRRSRHPQSSRPSGNPRCSRRSPPITHHDLLSTPATRTHSIRCARTSFGIAHRPTAVCARIMFVGAW